MAYFKVFMTGGETCTACGQSFEHGEPAMCELCEKHAEPNAGFYHLDCHEQFDAMRRDVNMFSNTVLSGAITQSFSCRKCRLFARASITHQNIQLIYNNNIAIFENCTRCGASHKWKVKRDEHSNHYVVYLE